MSRISPSRRLTRRLDLCAAADMLGLMRRRRDAGKSTVVPSAAKSVLWTLCNYANDDGEAWPSVETLAADAETSPRTVKRVVAILRDEGILHVVVRSRGGDAGRKEEARDGATNLYRIDWDSLGRAGDDHRGDDGENGGQSGPRSGPERGPAVRGTGVSGAPNGGQRCAPSKEEPPSEPPMNPPQPPAGDRRGGEERAVHQADHGTLREQAQAIVDAYPPTSSDLPEADRKAAIEAILAEADQPERCTWQEIRDAAAAIRVAKPKEPRWTRNWLKLRGYLPLVLEARRRAEAPPIEPGESMHERSERQLREHRERIAATETALSGLSDDELRAEHDALLAETTSPTVRRWLSSSDPRTNRIVRESIAARLVRKGLVTA